MVGEGLAEFFGNIGGGIGIWPFITAAVVAIFSIALVWILLAIVVPARNSPAKYFIRAKRDKKPVFFLDAGKYFRCVVGRDKVGTGAAEVHKIENGPDIIKGGQGLKYCEGILMGVAEDFRSLCTNIGIIDLMEMITAKNWNPEEVTKRLEEISEKLKGDLGIKDEIKELDDLHAAQLEELDGHYREQRDKIITDHQIVEEPHEPGKGND